VKVPVVNLREAYEVDRVEIDASMRRVMESGWYILGPEVESFEREFAHWLGTKHCVGVANGTDAIALALKAVGCGPGTTVVTVSHTVSATVAAIEQIGATPLLIDIEAGFYTMDPRELADVLDSPPANVPPIRAALPVHLYGGAADLRSIAAVCRRHGVALVDDCAHAVGATFEGEKIGATLADASCFSFYPTKNLGGFGDGGAVTTRDDAIAERVRSLRQYGWGQRYVSEMAGGVDSRLDELQAAILRVRLRRLDERQERRWLIARDYGCALPFHHGDAPNHLYVVRVPDRNAFMAHLESHGIQGAIHYPVPVHLQPAYRDRVALGPSGCRESERASQEVVSLPIYPEMTDEQLAIVCDALRSWK
jgi:dTDP-4-amino-4,6-dideoxygalactose transaminase